MPSIDDLDLLSAALDDALAAEERDVLTARLAQEPDLASELAALRAYRQLIKQAPTVLPPRDFRLDPSRFRRALPWWVRFGAFEVTGAVGVAAAILLIAVGALTGGGSAANAPAAGESSIAIAVTVAATPRSTFSATTSGSATSAASVIATENVRTDSLLLATESPASSPGDGAALIIPSALPVALTSVAPGAGLPVQLATSGGAAIGEITAATPAPTAAALRSAATESAAAESAAQPPAQIPPLPLPSATVASMQGAFAATSISENNAAAPAVSSTVAPEQLQDAASSTAESVTAKTEDQGASSLSSPTSAAPSTITPVRPVTPASSPVAPPPFLLIAGIALLVFSLVVFGLGRLRR